MNYFQSRHVAATLLLCLTTWHAGATAWPQVAVPANVREYQVDSITVIDGLPVQMKGFVSPQTQTELASWFRSSWGKNLVENRLGSKLILGQARGDYFISIQLEPAGRSTRAVLAVANLRAGMEQRPAAEAANARLLARLPAGTRVISRLGSIDGPRSATHIVLSNGHDEQLNGDQLIRMLRDDGMQLEHESKGRTMFFKGKGSEAMAVLSRGRDGQTTIVLNTTTVMEQYK